MGPDAEKSFREFVAARGTALFRAAYVLTGNQHQAEDLVQSALAKTAARWETLQKKDDPEGYVRRAMYHERVSWWRRRRKITEEATETLPEVPQRDTSGDVDLRIVVRAALAKLGPKQRAVLTLRFYEDRSEQEIAAFLGISVGTVRSQTHRALARLREIAPELRALDVPEEVHRGRT